MPVKVQADLPVKEILESENIFVMDETRAVHQDIRPLKIMILNLMPLKEDTELQLLRSLSNTSLQVDVTFLMVASHEAKNPSTSHLNTFYVKFENVRKNYYDGMIITGAPVETMDFEQVDYWQELCEIMDFSETNVYICTYLSFYTDIKILDRFFQFQTAAADIWKSMTSHFDRRFFRKCSSCLIFFLSVYIYDPGHNDCLCLFSGSRQISFYK